MVTELSLSWTGPYKFACERTENDIKFSWQGAAYLGTNMHDERLL